MPGPLNAVTCVFGFRVNGTFHSFTNAMERQCLPRLPRTIDTMALPILTEEIWSRGHAGNYLCTVVLFYEVVLPRQYDDFENHTSNE